jgi:signal transduction histidine kinase
LHNGLSGDLNAIRNYVIVLAKNELAEASKNSLNEIKIGIDDAIHFNRNLSHKLIPPHLEKLGLLIALKDYFERQKSNSSVQFELDCSEDNLPLEYSKAYEIYSIVYEFIANSKINKSTFCKLTIKQQKNSLIFDLINDGTHLYGNDLNIDKNRNDWQYLQSRINLINGTASKVQTEKGNHIKIQLKKINHD